MKGRDLARKKLFVCTKPYQYLICRLIKEGYNYKKCDLLILNHFEGAKQFARAVRRLHVWEQVFFEDDTALNKRNAQLTALQKPLFYHNWKRLLPSCITSYEEYDKLYFAHEGVAMEYGLMRQFAAQGKSTIIYEEGYGNYMSVNVHKSIKKYLKNLSHWFVIPGNYIGRLRYVDAVLLQRPDIISLDKRNPIRKKTRPLPLALREFLYREHIRQEMYNIYPELHSLSIRIQRQDAVTILLGEIWWDIVTNRKEYLNKVLNRINNVTGLHLDKIFIKQHPGEMKHLEGLTSGVEFIPKKLPLELFYLAASGKIKRLYLFTYGSTAVLNLWSLFSADCPVKIVIMQDSSFGWRYKLNLERFRHLADKFGVTYSVVNL